MPPLDPRLTAASLTEADVTTPAPAIQPAAKPTEQARAEAAAEKFESLFIGEMLKQMRRTTREFAGEDSIFKDRLNSEMLEFADAAVADSLASQRAFGIADAILKQLQPDIASPSPAPGKR